MMGQQQMGSNIAPFNNQGVPQRNLRAAVGIRNFLVGTPANDERFNFNERKAANDETIGYGGSVSYVPGMIPAMKKYDTTGAVDVNYREISELRTTGEYPDVVLGDPVQIRETTGENTVNPEQVKEALGKLEKVKANRGGFLKGLRERMGVAQEKMEAVAAKVGKAIEAYNKLEPKTKLAIGLTLTAGSMIGVASGATFLAGGIGILRFAMKGASTVAMYQGLEGMLDKKYAELENVSEARKKFMKVGALATAAFVNFGLTDALNNSGATDAMVKGLGKVGDFVTSLSGGVASAAYVMRNTSGIGVTAPSKVGWVVGSTGNQGVEPWSEQGPGEGGEYRPGQQPLTNSDGLSEGEEIVPSGQPAKVTLSGSPTTAMSTPSITPYVLDPLTKSFDTAPAAPTESMEVVGDDGVSAEEKSMRSSGAMTTEATVPVTEAVQPTPNKHDLGIEESFIKQGDEAVPTTSPDVAATSTNMVLEDGTSVQSGASTLESPATAVPESALTNEVPAKPNAGFVEADAIVVENTTTSASPSNQISFAPNATLSVQDMSNLSALNTLTGTEKFDTALSSAAQQIDNAKSFFSFGDNSNKIKASFLTVLQNNPSVSVDTLLTTDASSLSGRQGASLQEAQGILKRMIPEDVLVQGNVRESSVVSVLQNNFKA